MKRKQYSIFGILLIMAIIFAGCTTLSGRITVKGNEPHTYVVLVVDDSTEYTIVGDLAEVLRKEYQNKTVKVKGKIIKSKAAGIPDKLEVLEILEVLEK